MGNFRSLRIRSILGDIRSMRKLPRLQRSTRGGFPDPVPLPTPSQRLKDHCRPKNPACARYGGESSDIELSPRQQGGQGATVYGGVWGNDPKTEPTNTKQQAVVINGSHLFCGFDPCRKNATLRVLLWAVFCGSFGSGQNLSLRRDRKDAECTRRHKNRDTHADPEILGYLFLVHGSRDRLFAAFFA